MSRAKRRSLGQQLRNASAGKVSRLIILLVSAGAFLLLAVTIASGQDGNDGSPQPSPVSDSAVLPKDWVSTHDLVLRREALPCTGPKDPTNFEVFSAGPEVAGLPMTATVRRCDTASPDYEAPANRITYMYGECEIAEGSTGCAPPLEVQTSPACQRSRSEYSFEGKPLPSKELPKHGEADVVEFDFALESRIEVYTKASTIVIYADDPDLARRAVELLAPQEKGTPPATKRSELRKAPPEGLPSPADGAVEGQLQCQP
jgi:hypothetical protein